MIEYITGRLVSLTPATAIIETAGGLGYILNITLPTYTDLQNQSSAKLLVHESIREDAWTLYGFTTDIEREHFRLLIGVSGVGAATALIILSSLQGDELAAVISSGDVRRLKAIKGIGSKTAERIIVDLRDKIKGGDTTLSIQTGARTEAYDEASAALQMLGFDKKHVEKALTALFTNAPAMKVEEAVRKALSMM